MAGKVYELVVRGHYASQLIINRWYYIMSGTPASVTGSFALMSAAGFLPDAGAFPADTMAEAIAALVSNSLGFEEGLARDLYSVTDFYTAPFSPAVPGLQTGEASSPFLAFSFTGSRVRADIRRGQKRFAGVSESAIGVNGELVSTSITKAELVADRMTETLEYDDEGNTLTFVPAILGFEQYAPSVGHVAYRPYETETEQLEHVASGFIWTPNLFVTTQNSRKVGHGA